jgi:hypothetical protein
VYQLASEVRERVDPDEIGQLLTQEEYDVLADCWNSTMWTAENSDIGLCILYLMFQWLQDRLADLHLQDIGGLMQEIRTLCEEIQRMTEYQIFLRQKYDNLESRVDAIETVVPMPIKKAKKEIDY